MPRGDVIPIAGGLGVICAKIALELKTRAVKPANSFRKDISRSEVATLRIRRRWAGLRPHLAPVHKVNRRVEDHQVALHHPVADFHLCP